MCTFFGQITGRKCSGTIFLTNVSQLVCWTKILTNAVKIVFKSQNIYQNSLHETPQLGPIVQPPISSSNDRYHSISIGGTLITQSNYHHVGYITCGGRHYDDYSRASQDYHDQTLFWRMLQLPRVSMLEKIRVVSLD